MPRTPEFADADADAKPETATPLSARELRRRHRDAIRAKVTGKVVADAPPANRKIVFDDDDNDVKSDDVSKNNTEAEDIVTTAQTLKDVIEDRGAADDSKVANDHDSDDEAVEEVQTSLARQVEEEKRLQERKSARTTLQGKKKRKRKTETQPKEEVEVFDDDFFTQLAEEKQNARDQRQRARKLAREPQGRYTNFIVEEKHEEMALPTDAEGVQVAVLSHDVQAILSEPTPDSYIYSRARLESGRDGLSAKQIQKAKKRKQTPVENPSWQRSSKMNRILTAGRGRRTGMPALHFVKKKK